VADTQELVERMLAKEIPVALLSAMMVAKLSLLVL
jgi:hypothetical protein